MGRLIWTLAGILLAAVAIYSVINNDKRVQNGKN